jgi:eukaryotic-like serine/threonine-protein kinase
MFSPPGSRQGPLFGDTVELPEVVTNQVYIGPYELIRKLGSGGMGKVYLADDPRLNRRIALKMLPADFTQDRERVTRFVREARAASALNHPNIITILDIGEADGEHYIATEFIQGQTLRRLMNRPVTVELSLEVGIQVASALNAAHEAGIIHRDIKPENLMVRPDGLVKVLDFGVAKLVERQQSSGTPTCSENEPTLSLDDYSTNRDPYLATLEGSDGTNAGRILGTINYMSPEQIRRQKLDERSDIFSLGVVLYELIAGKQPFDGPTQADRVAAILDREPAPLTDYRSDVPGELARIIILALRKDRRWRYQHVKDMLADLIELKQELEFQKRHGGSDKQLAAFSLFESKGAVIRAVVQRRWFLLALGALVAFVLIAAGPCWFSDPTFRLTDRDTIVVADFINTTGDPLFDVTLRHALAAQLEQSPFLGLVPDERIQRTLDLMGRPKDARLTQQLVREVGLRNGSKATIEGMVTGSGGRYELHLKAVDSQSGDALVQLSEPVNGKEQIVPSLGKLATKLREQLGESLAALQKYDAPAESVTTGSIEALQAYSRGRISHAKADFTGAIAFFERAVSLDPNFAAAYSRLAANYNYTGKLGRAEEMARKAYELRHRASERERFHIESLFSTLVTEDPEAARKICSLWAQTYPRDTTPRNRLFSVYVRLGEYEKALSTVQQSLSLDPENGVSYVNLASLYLLLDRLDEAKATIQDARSKHIDPPQNHYSLYLISFMQNDTAGMEREAALLISKPEWEATVLQLESETAATAGQFSRARELVRRAIVSLQRAGKKESASGFHAQAALREALIGNLGLAKRQAEKALSLSNDRYCQAVSAIVLALAGESTIAAMLADGLAKRFPENTNIHSYHLPMVRAAAAIRSGNAAKAIDALVAATPYEMNAPRSVNNFSLYPVYLRGQAYLELREGASAVAEFQRIVDRPGLFRNQLIGPLAHLGLARAYSVNREAEKARTAYRNFLALWKDADPEVPILKEARAEYARLNDR